MLTDPIIRVFRATVKAGKEAAFGEFFLQKALPLVKRQDGLVSVQVGLPTSEHPQDFLMVTTWRDLESLKKFAGERWDHAAIDPEERPLLSQTSVFHYRDAGV